MPVFDPGSLDTEPEDPTEPTEPTEPEDESNTTSVSYGDSVEGTDGADLFTRDPSVDQGESIGSATIHAGGGNDTIALFDDEDGLARDIIVQLGDVTIELSDIVFLNAQGAAQEVA
ncbi:hypothetical protein KO498_00565 [Lentibacter algarum]|uniref:hypothetical protein n=1 Tax=Lentibacter algarum TaxID=576131 RepID=UPI001C0745A0|nr:hypothetical protein [Lentibacter algarum]MBU2980291.1 hypothetical protein [Lentibacter algarum]